MATLARYFVVAARLSLCLALLVIIVLAIMPVSQAPLASWNDKLVHILAFFTLAYLLDASFPRQAFDWRKGLFLLCYGLLIEYLQGETTHRQASAGDVLADLIGIGVYLLSIPILKAIPLVNYRWTQGSALCDRSG